MIIQVRLDPNQVEGEHSGYYNYEFGLAKHDYTDEDNDYIVDFSGGERGSFPGQNRRNYSVASHETSVIIDEED